MAKRIKRHLKFKIGDVVYFGKNDPDDDIWMGVVVEIKGNKYRFDTIKGYHSPYFCHDDILEGYVVDEKLTRKFQYERELQEILKA